MKVVIGANSFCPGEDLEVRLIPEDAALSRSGILNVSIDILRVDADRNRLAIGFGRPPEIDGEIWRITQKLPATLKPGLHCIEQIVLSLGADPETAEQRRIRIDPKFFLVRTIVELPPSEARLRDIIGATNTARERYIRTPTQSQRVRTGAPAVQFRVIVFATGCLLDSMHQMAGYKLVPLGQGLSHRRMLEIVNAGLQREGIESLPFIEATEHNFASNTPTFMIDYPLVSAVDHEDALSYCHEHGARIFRALCIERGAMPERFASFALQYGTSKRWHEFKEPWYRGNLIGGFDVAATADAVNRMLPKLEAQPFFRLLASTFTDGMRETEYGFKLLRYWSVLELVADQAVPRNATRIKHPDGTPILNEKGNPVDHHAKEARVYAYILASGAFQSSGSFDEQGIKRRYILGGDTSHPGYAPGVELIPLWDLVRSTYAIRNAIAHTGQFDELKAYPANSSEGLAVHFKKISPLDPMRFAEAQARMAIWRANA